jgi:hypothetical protein
VRDERRRGILANLSIAAGAVCLTLLAAESVVRFSAHRLLGGGEWVSTERVFMADPVLGFVLVPGSTRLLVAGGAYTARDRIGSAGLRDVERPVAKPAGIRRALVLGDSFVYGQGVALDESLPRRLASLLPAADVVNAGVPGYDLGQSYLYYKDRGGVWEADLVLLGFFINDLNPPPRSNPWWGRTACRRPTSGGRRSAMTRPA